MLNHSLHIRMETFLRQLNQESSGCKASTRESGAYFHQNLRVHVRPADLHAGLIRGNDLSLQCCLHESNHVWDISFRFKCSAITPAPDRVHGDIGPCCCLSARCIFQSKEEHHAVNIRMDDFNLDGNLFRPARISPVINLVGTELGS